MTQADLDPGTDVTLVQQQFDMQALLQRDIDAAQAMSYNEYAQLLEAENPDTGELYQPEDFTILDWNEVGTAMLQDAIWADTSRLEGDEAYQETTSAFLTASLQGWAYCRDNPEQCRDLVTEAGSLLGASHQLWQMNEVNKLIWPSPDGVGSLAEPDWERTVELSLTTLNQDGETVLTAAPEGLAYTNENVQQALDALTADGLEVTGSDFTPQEVTLNPGGE
jgi:NitT/TauT family transport system substrate-binding protein